MSNDTKTQEELELERVMDLFDQALTSKDERVINALRSLLMIVALTNPENPDDIKQGPWHQMETYMRSLEARVRQLEMGQYEPKGSGGYNPIGGKHPWYTTDPSQKWYVNPRWTTTTGPNTVLPTITCSTATSTMNDEWAQILSKKMMADMGMTREQMLDKVEQDLRNQAFETYTSINGPGSIK